MYKIDNTIKNQPFDKLKVQQLSKTGALEILSISLEKDTVFPEHSSPTDAELVILEGEIDFHIAEKTFRISSYQHFSFPREVTPWVLAKENSKFLIIR